ncbi:hypothetical protein Nmel_013817, partial [Mimus melanotis]
SSRVIESESSWTIKKESSGGQSGGACRPAVFIAPATPGLMENYETRRKGNLSF